MAKITPQQAMERAEAYCVKTWPDVHVVGLLEDARDYLAAVKYDGPERDGEEFVFVRKATGRVWTAAPGDGFRKYVKMRDVKL